MSTELPFATAVLEPHDIEVAIRNIPTVLRSLLGDTAVVTAEYRFGSGLHPDLCYVPMKVGLKWIDRFLDDSLRQEIVVPAKSDFYICAPDGQLEVEFCHEGDIHVGGNDGALVAKLRAIKPYDSARRVDDAA